MPPPTSASPKKRVPKIHARCSGKQQLLTRFSQAARFSGHWLLPSLTIIFVLQSCFFQTSNIAFHAAKDEEAGKLAHDHEPPKLAPAPEGLPNQTIDSDRIVSRFILLHKIIRDYKDDAKEMKRNQDTFYQSIYWQYIVTLASLLRNGLLFILSLIILLSQSQSQSQSQRGSRSSVASTMPTTLAKPFIWVNGLLISLTLWFRLSLLQGPDLAVGVLHRFWIVISSRVDLVILLLAGMSFLIYLIIHNLDRQEGHLAQTGHNFLRFFRRARGLQEWGYRVLLPVVFAIAIIYGLSSILYRPLLLLQTRAQAQMLDWVLPAILIVFSISLRVYAQKSFAQRTFRSVHLVTESRPSLSIFSRQRFFTWILGMGAMLRKTFYIGSILFAIIILAHIWSLIAD